MKKFILTIATLLFFGCTGNGVIVTFDDDKSNAINKYIDCSEIANKIGIELNAGHDLNQQNLEFFKNNIVNLKEVSIGHALISESIYSGLQSTIKSYLKILN